jgi:type II secretory pathway component GspD/PulD (secretin)
MKRSIFLIFAVLLSHSVQSQPPKQVLIETQIVETEDAFETELGIEWGIGPSIAHFTNIDNPNQTNIVGVNTFAGVDFYFHPIISVFGHFNLTQFGNGTKYPNGYNNIKFTNVGVDAGIKLHVKPRIVADPFVLIGIDFGGTVGGVIKDKQNGDKNTVRFNLNDQDNKAFAAVTGGAGVTIRTDVVDLTLQATVTGGLTTLDKNPLENTPRSVPFFAEIPLIVRFFGKKTQRERPNLLIFLTPEIIDPDEEMP